MSAGGWSLTACAGVIHETDGSVPASASSKKSASGRTFESWPSLRTVSNHGSGFQIPGVVAFCGTGAQNIASSLQSG